MDAIHYIWSCIVSNDSKLALLEFEILELDKTRVHRKLENLTNVIPTFQ